MHHWTSINLSRRLGQYLPKLKQGQSLSLDFIIGEAIKIANAHIKRDGKQEFIAELLKTLDRNKIVEGFRLLADFGVALLDDEAVRRRGYLTVEGEWDSAFAARFREQTAESLQAIVLPDRKSGLLTTEQTRIYRELSAQLDDHLHVQGYAGTGKSHLVRSLLVMLNNGGASVLVLAERQQQLKVMRKRSIDRILPRCWRYVQAPRHCG